MAPAAFDRCVRGGGKVRTKDLGDGKYIHICIKNGKSYAGYPKRKKGNKYSEGLKSGSDKKRN